MGPLEAVEAHLRAFNVRDLEGVLATFDDEAVFASGDLLLVGRRALRALFDEAFSGEAHAVLDLQSAVVQGDTAACELAERVRMGRHQTEFSVAGFFTVRDGRLARVKVYREGTG